MSEIVIRRATTFEDYQACQQAQRRAWGITGDGYVVPVATMVGAQLHGGLVLGAFAPDGTAVGLSFAFLGQSEGHLCLYSQLTGVVPEQQGLGIGYRLKQAQWEFARQQGLALVAWAFDPLQAGNAHFNLERLGASVGRYIENMYGPRSDALNRGAPTDRLIAEWLTTTAAPAGPAGDRAIARRLIVVAANGHWQLADDGWTAEAYWLEIPADIVQLRQTAPALADAWRQAVRAAFTAAFAHGYRATGFVRADGAAGRHCYYVLEKRHP